jgi:hypothetical protein
MHCDHREQRLLATGWSTAGQTCTSLIETHSHHHTTIHNRMYILYIAHNICIDKHVGKESTHKRGLAASIRWPCSSRLQPLGMNKARHPVETPKCNMHWPHGLCRATCNSCNITLLHSHHVPDHSSSLHCQCCESHVSLPAVHDHMSMQRGNP